MILFSFKKFPDIKYNRFDIEEMHTDKTLLFNFFSLII